MNQSKALVPVEDLEAAEFERFNSRAAQRLAAQKLAQSAEKAAQSARNCARRKNVRLLVRNIKLLMTGSALTLCGAAAVAALRSGHPAFAAFPAGLWLVLAALGLNLKS